MRAGTGRFPGVALKDSLNPRLFDGQLFGLKTEDFSRAG